MNKRAEILQTAEKYVNGDRAQSYGPPEKSFTQIAQLWGAMGFRVIVDGNNDEIRLPEATDVALALVQLKVARLISSPDHEDSWVDIAGYAGLGGEISLPARSKVGEPPLLFHKSKDIYICGECTTRVEEEYLLGHAENTHALSEYRVEEVKQYSQ